MARDPIGAVTRRRITYGGSDTPGGSNPIPRITLPGTAGASSLPNPYSEVPSISDYGGYTGAPTDVWYGGGNNFSGGSINTGALDTLRKDRLDAALAAIAAQFDYDEADLEGQKAALVELFKSGMKQNERDVTMTKEAVGDDASNRGLERSGIYAQNLARGLSPLADEASDLVRRLNPTEGAEGTEIRSLMSQIILLAQKEAAANAGAEMESRQSELDIDQLIALIQGNLNTG